MILPPLRLSFRSRSRTFYWTVLGGVLVWAALPAISARGADSWNFDVANELPHASGAIYRDIVARRPRGTAEIKVVVFAEKHLTVRVEDHPPGQPQALAPLAASTGAIAGINASYFHPDSTPLGLVVASGKVLHPQEKAKLLSGIFAVTRERPLLLRAGEFKLGTRTVDAVQAGPFLVDEGAAPAGLETKRFARRTFVVSLGKGRWALGSSSAVPLATLGEILSTPGALGEGRVVRALNMDGGSSTAFWFDASPKPISTSAYTAVRNHLLLVPKSKR